MSLTEKDMQDITEMFKFFDKNKDGTMSTSELGQLLRGLGLNPNASEINECMQELDSNDNGVIDFQEFMDFMSRRGRKSQQEEEEDLLAAFKVFDRNGDGFISSSELRQTLSSLGEKMSESEIEQMMQEADLNTDGYVEYSEFVKIICARS